MTIITYQEKGCSCWKEATCARYEMKAKLCFLRNLGCKIIGIRQT